MQAAIDLALEAVAGGIGGPFAAVIVKDHRVIGRGINRVVPDNDPTAHAEIVAIRDACRHFGTFTLSDCEIYVNCEPCPMCLCALMWARVSRIYFGCTRQDAAAVGFDDERFYNELALPVEHRPVSMQQIMRKEALSAFRAWQEKPERIPY